MQKASDLNIAKVEDSALPKPTYKLVHLYPSCCEHWITIPDATFSRELSSCIEDLIQG